ncbi:MAG: HU family DNA-binding protein [Aquificae bacterium]|nr:HU family DNA-binding protein [Aquificota bacterium]
MTKKKLAARVSEASGGKIAKTEAYELIRELFDILVEGILRHGRVQVSGFGTFTVKTRKAKKGMDLKRMKAITIPERRVVVFKPSKTFYREG